MYDITGYNLFRNDNHNAINESRPYGGTPVCSNISYFLPGYPYCLYIYGIEVTIKIIRHEDWTILGLYCSPKVPVRQLCQTITEVLNGMSP